MERRKVEAKLLSLRFRNENGCWLYGGTRHKGGYGSMKIGGRNYLTHRLSAWLYLSLDINDLTKLVCHKDDCNRRCFNPEHLYIGTSEDNRMDFSRNITHCVNGHELTKDNLIKSKGVQKICKICHRETWHRYNQRRINTRKVR